ncbi:MAG: sigma-54-dependent Fis family transcriptional regulator [Deltaproteobacteria bacterium]|nr:sigma-54-dependent Fis family transcriptional regulator [Deltaproteobacteria bacterium]
MLEILLIDDEPSIRLSVGDALGAAGHRVTLASDGREGLRLATHRAFDVVVTDVRLPGADGLTIFREVKRLGSTTDVILITAFGAVDDAVTAMKEGAHDYLTKPFDVAELVLRIERIADRRRIQRELDQARAELAARDAGALVVGQSPPMVRLLDRIETMAQSDAAVLITGESGTGKELVARALHEHGPRRGRPFVAVNCAAFPETLLEAELFGHERGAFTGAVRKRDGRFRAADGGTLFLDEIAEIPLPAQAKLLRVLQDGAFEPLGTNTSVRVDVRLVCATHRNLKEHIATARFREDLYYRVNVLDLHIPALRERRGDLPLLAQHFLRRYVKGDGPVPPIAPRAWAALSQYPFPGNVRELEHALEHAFVLSRGAEIDIQHLPADIAGSAGELAALAPPRKPLCDRCRWRSRNSSASTCCARSSSPKASAPRPPRCSASLARTCGRS